MFLAVSRVFRGIMGCSGGFPGLFRAVRGCSGGVPGMFWGVRGVFRGVPSFTHTPKVFSFCREEDEKKFNLNKLTSLEGVTVQELL